MGKKNSINVIRNTIASYKLTGNKVNQNTKLRIIECLKIGTPLQEIQKQFDITEGAVLNIMLFFGMYGDPTVKLGFKNEAYFTGDFPLELPKYSISDLSDEELEILKQIENPENL